MRRDNFTDLRIAPAIQMLARQQAQDDLERCRRTPISQHVMSCDQIRLNGLKQRVIVAQAIQLG